MSACDPERKWDAFSRFNQLRPKGWRDQDIQALVNIDRPATGNSARITKMKKNNRQRAALPVIRPFPDGVELPERIAMGNRSYAQFADLFPPE